MATAHHVCIHESGVNTAIQCIRSSLSSCTFRTRRVLNCLSAAEQRTFRHSTMTLYTYDGRLSADHGQIRHIAGGTSNRGAVQTAERKGGQTAGGRDGSRQPDGLFPLLPRPSVTSKRRGQGAKALVTNCRPPPPCVQPQVCRPAHSRHPQSPPRQTRQVWRPRPRPRPSRCRGQRKTLQRTPLYYTGGVGALLGVARYVRVTK